MSIITKEWLRSQISAIKTIGITDSNTLQAFEIALASLEAEPVAYMYKDNLHADARFSLHTRFGNWSQEDINEYEITEIPLYTAPPAPVSVPDMATPQSMRTMFCQLDDSECAIAADVWNSCRAAMLQGAENAESPTTMQTAPSLDSSQIIAESTSGNSPVIPDGWVMVPVEPTYQMCKAMGLPWESPRFPDRYKAMIAAAPHFREIWNSSTNNFRENAETSTKCWCRTCRPVTISDMRFVVCPECGNKRCPHANDHRNACTGSNEPGQEGSAYPAAPQQEVKP